MAIKQKRPKKQMVNPKEIQYVIYCRKSQEESSGEQQQSILDQLKRCMIHADAIEVDIMRQNDIFEEYFNDSAFQRRKAKQTNKHELDILSKADGLFYVVEEKSAKVPNNREKRTKLIKLVKAWKIKWILSYAPDRQARNLPEAWELVQLLDDGLLDVKYKNFTFENNANGRMVLWITFVISYNYSDNLSQAIWRWNIWAIERWTALWTFKHGYIINDEKYHEPDPESFQLRRNAFDMKLDGKSDKEISNYLTASGYKRKYKSKTTDLNPKSLYKVRVDDFYYGKFIHWLETIDLRDANPYYKPMITEEEHTKLDIRYKSNNWWKPREVKTEDEQYNLRPFENWFIITEEWQPYWFNLPNRGRFESKLNQLKKTNPKVWLWDVIQLNQMNYKTSWWWGKEICYIQADEIDNAVYEFLSTKMRLTPELYEKYIDYQRDIYDIKTKQNNEERQKLNLSYNNINSKLNEFVRKNMHKDKNPIEQDIYNKEIQKHQEILDTIKNDLQDICEIERNTRLEAEAFFTLLKEAPSLYKNAKYVRKRKICNLLFSNIIVTKQKGLLLAPKVWLEELFSWIGGEIRENFEHIDKAINNLPPKYAKELVNFYVNVNPDQWASYNYLSQRQRSYYWINK